MNPLDSKHSPPPSRAVGGQDAVDGRREDFKLGIPQFEREEAGKREKADLTESGEFLSTWAGAGEALPAESYNYAAAKRDGEDPNVALPDKYVAPGAVQLFGRDLASNRPVVDPSGGYFERFEATQEALSEGEGVRLPDLNVPTRVLANATLGFLEGLGGIAEDLQGEFPEEGVSWKSGGMNQLLGQLAKFQKLPRPEALQETSGFIEELATDLATFTMGWTAAPLKAGRLPRVAREMAVGAQAAQVLPAEDTIGTALAENGLLPEALWFLNAKGLRENDHVFLSRLGQAVEEGGLTAAGAALIYGVMRAARRIRAAEGDSLLERGFTTIFDFGGTTPKSRQRGSLDVGAAPSEDVAGAAPTGRAMGEAAVEVIETSPRAGELEEATMRGLVDIVEGLQLKGLDPEEVHTWAASDGRFTPEQVDAALVTAGERTQQRVIDAPGAAAGPQREARLNQPPSADAPPSARSAQLIETEDVRPLGPYPGAIDPAKVPAGADVDTVTEASGAGLLPTGRPVSYQGKDIPDWSPEDWQGFGREHGVERLGPLTGRVDVGEGVEIPGGLEGEFTFVDLMWLKAQGYNPREWPMELRAALQRKLSRSLTPEPGDHVETFNRYVFGMLSPNQPLTPNEFEYSRVRAPSMDAIKEWAALIDWEPGADVPIETRRARTDEIAEMFGVQASGRGGLGLRSSSVITDVAEFAKLFLKDPDFFTKQPGESWHQFTEKVMSQARGLSAKVASFSVVWQDPLEAGISAVDRHMAAAFKPQLLADPVERGKFETKVVKKWNDRIAKAPEKRAAIEKEIRRVKANRGKKLEPRQRAELLETLHARLEMTNVEDLAPAESIDDVVAQRTGSTVLAEGLMGYITQSPGKKFRTAKGEVNPNIPEHLAGADWIQEPEKVNLIGEVYRRALAANDAAAQQQGLHLFSSQWMIWDGLRGRLEPHEVMFPGLYKLPKPSREQAEAAMAEHKAAGFFGAPKRESATEVDPLTGAPTKEMVPLQETKAWEKKGGMDWWKAGYFSILPMLGAGLVGEPEGET